MRKSSSLQTLAFFVLLGIGSRRLGGRVAAVLFRQRLDRRRGRGGRRHRRRLNQGRRPVAAGRRARRLGRFRSLEGPGLFFIIPIIETVPYLD